MLDSIKKIIYKLQNLLILLFRKIVEFACDSKQKIDNLYKTNYDIAMFHLRRGNFSDANLRLKIMEKFYPNDINIKYNSAICFLAMNKKNKAIKKLEEILKINPEIKEIQDLLSEINNNNIILYNFKEE